MQRPVQTISKLEFLAMTKITVLICLLLFPLGLLADEAFSDTSTEQTSIAADTITGTDEYLSVADTIQRTIDELILPNLPGATLLFVISVLISTLTFYADLKRSNLSSKGSNRYLVLWIFGNYSFALVLLILILPEGTSLTELDRTFLLYCIIASGLPEMSAYIKIQLGNTNKGVNLYKIREMFTNYIARRVNLMTETSEWHELNLFKYAFIGKLQLLNEKLIAFTNVCNFSDAEKNEILACLPSANNSDIDDSVGCLMSLSAPIKSKLFNFFREDLHRYQLSSSAKLVKNLYPPISAMEAQSLVTNGVISPLRFLFRTLGSSQRNKLANITHIENDKLALLHNELKGVYRLKIKRFMMGIVVFFIFIIFSSLMLSKQAVLVAEQEVDISGKNAITTELLPE